MPLKTMERLPHSASAVFSSAAFSSAASTQPTHKRKPSLSKKQVPSKTAAVFDSTPWDSLSYTQLVAISRPTVTSNSAKKPRKLSLSTTKPLIQPSQAELEQKRRQKEEEDARTTKANAEELSAKHRARGAHFFRAGRFAAALVEYTQAVDACFTNRGSKKENHGGPMGRSSIKKSQSLDLSRISRSPSGLKYGSLNEEADDVAEYRSPVVITVDPALYVDIALCHSRLGDHLAATECATRALESDSGSIRAWWIRAEAKRATFQLRGALDDAEMCAYLLDQWTSEKIAEETFKQLAGVPVAAETNNPFGPAIFSEASVKRASSRPPSPAFTSFGFTQYDVRRMISSLQAAISDAEKAEHAAIIVTSTDSKKLDTLVNLLTSLLVRHRTSDISHCERATAALVSHINTTPALAAAFRACRGFDRLLSPPVFNAETARHVLPVVLASLSDPANRREMAPHAARLVGITDRWNGKQCDAQTASMIAKVIACGAKEEAFLEALGDLRREPLVVA
ncbi:hypothetical protein M427DRAFT_151186 [Gonapodya prolifera JEL478]|uniref:TPR-like protein n=1 Tax=Gonapodya prolifera (strain JEL478) TaxID=1344416 RepID=A0A139AYW2_GONPJ|nr:hypothetical protein M427DRAFT_151186 [Gonapodya prolifera JEL478]|eukprot:KXS21938.1 hypothetical protein M427DRAFT_151186 [Gonapodya prolifera JEL478]